MNPRVKIPDAALRALVSKDRGARMALEAAVTAALKEAQDAGVDLLTNLEVTELKVMGGRQNLLHKICEWVRSCHREDRAT